MRLTYQRWGPLSDMVSPGYIICRAQVSPAPPRRRLMSARPPTWSECQWVTMISCSSTPACSSTPSSRSTYSGTPLLPVSTSTRLGWTAIDRHHPTSAAPRRCRPGGRSSINKEDANMCVLVQYPFMAFNPRPAGPLDFPPPAGGGGAFERPPHDLGSWSP